MMGAMQTGRPSSAPDTFFPPTKRKSTKAVIVVPVGADGSIDTAQAYASQVADIITKGAVLEQLRFMAEYGHRRIPVLGKDGEPDGQYKLIPLTNREHLAAIKNLSNIAFAHTRIQGATDGTPGDDAKGVGESSLETLLAKEDD